MKNLTKYIVLFSIVIGISVTACKNSKKENTQETASIEKIVPENLKWSERMMLSEIERFPKASLLDFTETPRWSYTNGLVLSACARVYEQTKR